MQAIRFRINAPGIHYACPRCNGASPVRRASVQMDKIIVEAECQPCRTMIAKEFLLTGRSADELLTLSFIREERA